MRAYGRALPLLVFLVAGLSGCIFDDDPPVVRDPRYHGYTMEELERNFTRTTDRVLGLDDLGDQSLVVIELVAEADPSALKDVITFTRPQDTPEAETPRNFCGEFRSADTMWAAATTNGAFVARQETVPPVEVRYEAPQVRFDRATTDSGASRALFPFYVLFGVDDVDAWREAGADAAYHIEGGAVWWRIIEEGTLRCVFQPSDHEEGTVTQSHVATRATAVRSSFEASEHAVLELVWRADRLTLSLLHNETELFRQTESGSGGRMVAPLEPGHYEVRYDDVEHFLGAAYAGFVLRDIDASRVPLAGEGYWVRSFVDT